MRIHSLSITRTSENVEKISAGLDETEIYFEVTGAPDRLRESYDPFVLAAFPYAMVKGGEMEVDGDAPVSRPLVENLHRAIEMYLQWWPYLADLRICPTRVEDHPPKGSGHVGCFFSGGVDSLYSYERNAAEITHLILCLGLDMGFDEMERWNRTVEFVSDVADARGKGLVLVKTNAKAPLRMPGRADGHGARLSSTAMAAGFGTLIIPASNSLDQLAPWGSHPMLDPLFSNGVTEVIHDSPIPRSAKTKALVEGGVDLDALRVCNVRSLYNCGECEKCLRTRFVMTLLGVESQSLKAIRDPKLLRQLKLHSANAYRFWMDNLLFAGRMGRHDFVREIGRITRSWRVREALRQLDDDLTGGRVFRLKRKFTSRE